MSRILKNNCSNLLKFLNSNNTNDEKIELILQYIYILDILKIIKNNNKCEISNYDLFDNFCHHLNFLYEKKKGSSEKTDNRAPVSSSESTAILPPNTTFPSRSPLGYFNHQKEVFHDYEKKKEQGKEQEKEIVTNLKESIMYSYTKDEINEIIDMIKELIKCYLVLESQEGGKRDFYIDKHYKKYNRKIYKQEGKKFVRYKNKYIPLKDYKSIVRELKKKK